MSPLISHGPVFVQSGASRSIVIESLCSFRPFYLPLRHSPSASHRPRRSRSSFYSHAEYGRSFHRCTFLLISPHWQPRDFILSPQQRAFFHAHCRRKIGMALDAATAGQSTSAEFAEGAERRTREGVVIRHNTEPVSSKSIGREWKDSKEKYARNREEKKKKEGVELLVSMAEVITLFLSCYYVYRSCQYGRTRRC